MPEGPEIRREADLIASVLEGRRLTEVRFGLARLRCYEPELLRARVSRVQCRGKALLTHFDNGLTMYSHNQLYGKWMVCKPGETPKTNRSLRAALHTQTGSALLYSASEIEVLDTALLSQHPFLSKLGPDILDETIGWKDVASRLRDERFRNRKLASLYLDQKFMAGVGNYLRSEILFHAGVDPGAKPNELTRGQLGSLARATLSISRRSYATAGITNTPGVVKALKRDGASRRYYRFAVFDRDGLPCYRCGREISRATMNSRRLYQCPECQKRAA